jgi:hypothetical protein
MNQPISRVAQHLAEETIANIDPLDLRTVLLLANGTADEAWALNLDRVISSWQDRNNNQRRSLDRMVNKFLRVQALLDAYDRDLKPDLGVSAKETIFKIRQELDK